MRSAYISFAALVAVAVALCAATPGQAAIVFQEDWQSGLSQTWPHGTTGTYDSQYGGLQLWNYTVGSRRNDSSFGVANSWGSMQVAIHNRDQDSASGDWDCEIVSDPFTPINTVVATTTVVKYRLTVHNNSTRANQRRRYYFDLMSSGEDRYRFRLNFEDDAAPAEGAQTQIRAWVRDMASNETSNAANHWAMFDQDGDGDADLELNQNEVCHIDVTLTWLRDVINNQTVLTYTLIQDPTDGAANMCIDLDDSGAADAYLNMWGRMTWDLVGNHFDRVNMRWDTDRDAEGGFDNIVIEKIALPAHDGDTLTIVDADATTSNTPTYPHGQAALLAFRASVNANEAGLMGVKVQMTGTGALNQIDEIAIRTDPDGDVLADIGDGGIVLGSATFNVNPKQVLFDETLKVLAGYPQTLLLTYKFKDGAVGAGTYKAKINVAPNGWILNTDLGNDILVAGTPESDALTVTNAPKKLLVTQVQRGIDMGGMVDDNWRWVELKNPSGTETNVKGLTVVAQTNTDTAGNTAFVTKEFTDDLILGGGQHLLLGDPRFTGQYRHDVDMDDVGGFGRNMTVGVYSDNRNVFPVDGIVLGDQWSPVDRFPPHLEGNLFNTGANFQRMFVMRKEDVPSLTNPLAEQRDTDTDDNASDFFTGPGAMTSEEDRYFVNQYYSDSTPRRFSDMKHTAPGSYWDVSTHADTLDVTFRDLEMTSASVRNKHIPIAEVTFTANTFECDIAEVEVDLNGVRSYTNVSQLGLWEVGPDGYFDRNTADLMAVIYTEDPLTFVLDEIVRVQQGSPVKAVVTAVLDPAARNGDTFNLAVTGMTLSTATGGAGDTVNAFTAGPTANTTIRGHIGQNNSGNVVISELMCWSGAVNRFIELYNNSPIEQPLDNWSVQKRRREASPGMNRWADIVARGDLNGMKLLPWGYFMIACVDANTTNIGTADFIVSTSATEMLNFGNDGVLRVVDNRFMERDLVAFTDNNNPNYVWDAEPRFSRVNTVAGTFTENTSVSPAEDFATGNNRSLERKARRDTASAAPTRPYQVAEHQLLGNGWDTDSNIDDFIQRPNNNNRRDPQVVGSPGEKDGIPDPECRIQLANTPPRLNFANVGYNTVSTMDFAIYNGTTGTRTLTVFDVLPIPTRLDAEGWFTIDAKPATVAARSTGTVTVSFAPTSAVLTTDPIYRADYAVICNDELRQTTFPLDLRGRGINQGPELSPDPLDFGMVLEDAVFTTALDLYTTDPNGTPGPYTYARVGGANSGWLSCSSGGILTGIPRNGNVGVATANIRATDSLGVLSASAVSQVVLTIVNVNDAPVFSHSPFFLTEAYFGSPFAHVQLTTGSVTTGTKAIGLWGFRWLPDAIDVDLLNTDEALTFALVGWDLPGGAPNWIGVTPGGLVYDIAPATAGHDGPNSFTITVTDDEGGVGTGTMVIQVVAPKPPFWSQPIMVKADAEAAKNYATQNQRFIRGVNPGDPDFTDENLGDSHKFTKLDGPSWLAIGLNTGNLGGTPPRSADGPNTFTVVVTDTSLKSDTATLVINVFVPPAPEVPNWIEYDSWLRY